MILKTLWPVPPFRSGTAYLLMVEELQAPPKVNCVLSLYAMFNLSSSVKASQAKQKRTRNAGTPFEAAGRVTRWYEMFFSFRAATLNKISSN